jgi:hypothetical protein
VQSSNWQCSICGTVHQEIPLCFGLEAPWWRLVPEAEFEKRVQLNGDQCVVDKKHFFIRGHIELPILDCAEKIIFSVWSSLSEKSFLHMCDRWDSADRENDPPYFGWLSSAIPIYPDTNNLKLSVQSRAPGIIPLFTVEPMEHPLARDQQNGISLERWHKIAHDLLECSNRQQSKT